MKRVLTALLSLAVIIVLIAAPLSTFVGSGLKLNVNAIDDIIRSGNCGASGSNVTWNLDYDGTLVISGKGAMANYWAYSSAGSSGNRSPFSETDEIKSVVIEDGVTTIGTHAFYESRGIASVTIGNSVTAIGGGAFTECFALKNITIPNSVMFIGSQAFWNCCNLTSVTLGNNVTTIGDSAFRYCGLTSVVIPNSVTTIDTSAFEKCADLKSLTIGNNVTTIGDYAFEDCESLKMVTIPNSVTSIGLRAFYGCNNLANVTLPDSVTSIGGYAFGYSTDDNYRVKKIANFTIYGYKDSEAERYTKENGFAFISLSPIHTHTYTSKITKNATCTKAGVKTYTCSKCGDTYTETIKTTGHKTKTTTTKATTSKAGKIVTACTVCGTTTKTVTIAKASTISLSATSYTYDGKAKKPTVTVKDSNGKALKSGTDYSVSYASGRKNIGSYTVKVTLKGNYSGTKTLTFKIIPAKVTSLKAKTQATKSVTLSWKKVSGATGYVVYKYDSAKKAYVKVKATTGTSYKVTDLKAGTAYKFKVRAYKKVDGKNIYSAYSSVKSVKIK